MEAEVVKGTVKGTVGWGGRDGGVLAEYLEVSL